MIDIYCDIIDNFGDIAFAIKVINTYHFEGKGSHFRFFSNNKELFEVFQKNFLSEVHVSYQDISEISLSHPSPEILNLFERKIDYIFLESFEYPIRLINFSYFSLEAYKNPLSPGIQEFHGKTVTHKNLTVKNFSVSLLKNTGGVFSEKNYLPEILSKEYFIETYKLPKDKKWISIFCYPETQELLETQGFFQVPEEFLFLSFGKQELATQKSMTLPFLTMQEYYSLLQLCHANMVRGENSLIPAFESQAPFFWDIYKESNQAHIEKIQDFTDYLRDAGYSEALIQAQLEGNITRDYTEVKNLFFG